MGALLMLGFIVLSFALMFGVLSRRTVGRAIVALIMIALLVPFLPLLVREMPRWVGVVVIGWLFIAFLRAIATLFVGRGAGAVMIGTLAADAVRALVRAAFAPSRHSGRG